MRSVAIETLGCKLNQADSLELAQEFKSAGFNMVDAGSKCDVYVINTCTVTHVADRKGRQAVRAARRKHPKSTIVVTGCYVERDKTSIEALSEVDIVLGNTRKPDIVIEVLKRFDGSEVPNNESDDYEMPDISNRSRAMLKIQEGCDQLCSYCIVPKVRGREKSVPSGVLVNSVNRLVGDGYMEVVLTGTQLGSYGFDLESTSLASMITDILNKTSVARLRISSLQPQELSEELLELWQDKRLCPHFHIPLQSGSDSILARMRRRYDSSQFMKSVDDVRKNVEGASVTTDLIVGFPGESKQDHLDTKRICEAVGFADLHVFRFSSRPGTIAFHMDDDVRDPTKAYRSNELIDIGRQSFSKFRRSLDGNVANVLWEAEAKDRSNSDRFFGLTENYIRVSSEKYRSEMPIEEVTLVFNANDPYGPMQCLG